MENSPFEFLLLEVATNLLKSDKENENAAISLANILIESGRYHDAINRLRGIIKLSSKNRVLVHNLGLWLVTIGEFKEGWKAIESLWEKEDRDSSFWYKKAKNFWKN